MDEVTNVPLDAEQRQLLISAAMDWDLSPHLALLWLLRNAHLVPTPQPGELDQNS
jgi:hypothetical protein